MKRSLAISVAAAAVSVLLAPANSSASTTIGQLAPTNPPTVCVGGPSDVNQSALSSGTPYVVPAGGGTITSWSTNAGAGAGQTLKLKILRLVSGTNYTIVAHDGPRNLVPSTLNTFAVNIPVQAGDLIALNDQNAPAVHNACLFSTGLVGDVFGSPGVNTDPPDGTTESFAPTAVGYRLNLTAVVGSKPSNADTLGKVKLNRSKGTATLAVHVPAPGTLTLTGNGVKAQRQGRAATASKTVAAAGTVKLLIKAKGSAKRKLNRTGHAKVKVRVTYTPNGTASGDLVGDPNTQIKKIKLERR